jgi:hypothetical protein
MPKKKPPDPNEKPQRQRFIDLAKMVGADMTEEEFQQFVTGALRPAKRKKKR